jgi:hypothetical protein
MTSKKNYTVRICEDYIVRDSDKVKQILERVSKIISNSYIEKESKK